MNGCGIEFSSYVPIGLRQDGSTLASVDPVGDRGSRPVAPGLPSYNMPDGLPLRCHSERGINVNDRDPEVFSEFLRVAGLRFDEIGGERVRGSIELGERHHTPWGVVHGGVYTAAVESAASVGASAAVEEKGQFAVGVSNSTDFLRPVEEGRVDVVAEPIMQGKIQQLWQVIITRSGDGKEVARGQLRLQNVPLPG